MTDPDGARWEWYVKTGDSDQLTNEIVGDGETADVLRPGCGRAVAVGTRPGRAAR